MAAGYTIANYYSVGFVLAPLTGGLKTDNLVFACVRFETRQALNPESAKAQRCAPSIRGCILRADRSFVCSFLHVLAIHSNAVSVFSSAEPVTVQGLLVLMERKTIRFCMIMIGAACS